MCSRDCEVRTARPSALAMGGGRCIHSNILSLPCSDAGSPAPGSCWSRLTGSSSFFATRSVSILGPGLANQRPRLQDRPGGPDLCGSVGWEPFCIRQKSLVGFPVRACAWVEGSVPGRSVCERQLIDVSLSHGCSPLSPSLPLSLPFSLKSINISLGED